MKYYYTTELDLMKALLNLDMCDMRPPRSHRFTSVWRVLHIDGFENPWNTVQFYVPVRYEFKLGVAPTRVQC